MKVSLKFCRRILLTSAGLFVAVALVVAAGVIPTGQGRHLPLCLATEGRCRVLGQHCLRPSRRNAARVHRPPGHRP